MFLFCLVSILIRGLSFKHESLHTLEEWTKAVQNCPYAKCHARLRA
jgi:hypothetical protein